MVMDTPKRTPEEKRARRAETMRAVAAIAARRRRPDDARTNRRPVPSKRPVCGARCRDGHACTARVVWLPGEPAPRNGRCAMHGGLSTGARTDEGRAKIRAGLAGARAERRAEARVGQ